MKRFLFTAVAFSLLSSSAFAACTQEEIMRKAADLQTAFQDLARKDPKRYSDAMAKYRAVAKKAATNPDDVCKAYDDLAATIK